MPRYPYQDSIAFDPITRAIATGVGEIFALEDINYTTPLAPLDVNGNYVELRAMPDTGYLPTFYVEDHTEVRFRSGPWVKILVTTVAVPGEKGEPGPDGARGIQGPVGSLQLQDTVDRGNSIQIVAYANGTLRAIPATEGPAPAPGAPTVDPGASAITVNWTIPSGASYVELYRDGILVYRGSGTRYRDSSVNDLQVYTYSLIAFSSYDWKSDEGPSTEGRSNQSLNVAPEAVISTWPNPLPRTGRGYVRVHGQDIDLQQLVYALSVTNGTLSPTVDPSVWVYTAIER